MAAELEKLAVQLFIKGDVPAAQKVKTLAKDPDMPASVAEATNREELPDHLLESNIVRTYPPHVEYNWGILPDHTIAVAQHIEDEFHIPFLASPHILLVECPEQEKPLFGMLINSAIEEVKKLDGYMPAGDGMVPCKPIVYDGLHYANSPKSSFGVSFNKHAFVSDSHYTATVNRVIGVANKTLERMDRNKMPYLTVGR